MIRTARGELSGCDSDGSGGNSVRPGLSFARQMAFFPTPPPTLLGTIQIRPLKQPIFNIQIQSPNQSNSKKHILTYPSSFLTPSQHHPYTHSITTIITTYHLNKSHQKNPSYIPTFFHSQDRNPKISIIPPLIQPETLSHFQQIRTV